MRYGLMAVLASVSSVWADDIVSGLQIQEVPVKNSNGSAHMLGPVLDLRFLPDGRMVFIEKTGAVKVRATDGTVTQAYRFCVDTGSEKGLLGVEVDPQFNGSNNRRLFFYYSNCSSDGGTNNNRHRVVSVDLRPDNTLDASTEKILVQNLLGPANHDGGALTIGADGKLYIGVGDTGCNQACCPAGNMYASCLSNGNGKILRINLDGSIPTDNPLSNTALATACGASCTTAISSSMTAAPRKEIWAWGFRNPFRITKDPVTGKIWVGDVGEGAREEIDIAQAGKHFGYPWFEGNMGDSSYTDSKCDSVTPSSGNCVRPVWECNHGTDCNSIAGGSFIDGPVMPAQFRGYWFGDTVHGTFRVLHLNAARDGVADAGAKDTVLGHFTTITGVNPVSIQRGLDGLPYFALIDINGGAQGRLTRVSPVGYDGGFGSGGGTGGGAGGNGGGSAGGIATGGGSAGGSSGTGGGDTSATGGSSNGGGNTDGGTGNPMTPDGCRCDSSSLTLMGLPLLAWLLRRRRETLF